MCSSNGCEPSLVQQLFSHVFVRGDPERRRYVLGTVNSDYVLVDLNGSPLHARRVQWTNEVARDALSTETKNSLGAIQTIFKIRPDVAKDLEANARPLGATVSRDAHVRGRPR